MAEPRTRWRTPRSFRIGAVLAALVMLLGLVFVGIGSADEIGGDGEGGLGGLGGGAPRVAGPRSYEAQDDTDEYSEDYTEDYTDDYSEDYTEDYSEDSTDDEESDEPDDTAEDPDAPADTGGSDLYVPKKLADEIVPGTPCTKRAVACVSLGAKKSWLFKKDAEGNTVIDHGPIVVSTGGPGKETPVGDFVVEWKNKNHRSKEYFAPHGCTPGTPNCLGAPMNWAVFFAEGGIAFHEGTLNQRSSGCVRLSAVEAEFFYNYLSLGDKVEVRG